MKLYLVKPDLIYYEKYNDMVSEWCASKTQIAPWFLDSTIMSIDEFAQFVRMLDDCEHGIVDKRFSAASSYFVVDENDRLIGAAYNGPQKSDQWVKKDREHGKIKESKKRRKKPWDEHSTVRSSRRNWC